MSAPDQLQEVPKAKSPRRGILKHLIAYPVVALISIGIGSSGSSGAAPVAAASPATVTQTAPAPPAETVTSTVSVPGPTKTVVSPKPAQTVVVKVTPPPVTAFPGDGMYQVGVDISPGTYRSPAPGANCYWARLSSASTSDIIDNSNSTGQSVVVIQPTDKFFESHGCSDWTH